MAASRPVDLVSHLSYSRLFKEVSSGFAVAAEGVASKLGWSLCASLPPLEMSFVRLGGAAFVGSCASEVLVVAQRMFAFLSCVDPKRN